MSTLARVDRPTVFDLSTPPTGDGWYAGFGSYMAHRPSISLGQWRPAPGNQPHVFIARCLLWLTHTPAADELIRCTECASNEPARNGLQAC